MTTSSSARSPARAGPTPTDMSRTGSSSMDFVMESLLHLGSKDGPLVTDGVTILSPAERFARQPRQQLETTGLGVALERAQAGPAPGKLEPPQLQPRLEGQRGLPLRLERRDHRLQAGERAGRAVAGARPG